ncbi:MAG: lmo0937 family membrane protein [Cytophagaceae bacterium]|nr:lmo0937 family membrane protein [Cytophagaceae bacterium]
MRSILYIIAVVLVIAWAVGYFGNYAGGSGLIHILLVIAVVSILLTVIRRGGI